jgi:hypothetical protein
MKCGRSPAAPPERKPSAGTPQLLGGATFDESSPLGDDAIAQSAPNRQRMVAEAPDGAPRVRFMIVNPVKFRRI